MRTARRAPDQSRSFVQGALLTVLTLGVYGVVWHWNVYRELQDEFYLKPCPRWARLTLWIPLVGLPGYAVFMDRLIEDLTAVRSKMGLETQVTLRGHMLWTVAGGLLFVGPFLAYKRLQDALNEVWATLHEEQETSGRKVSPLVRV